MNLETFGPIQPIVTDVQCTGQEYGLLSCSYETVTAEMLCESAAAEIVCQGSYSSTKPTIYVHANTCT